MYCPQCGTANDETAGFCTKCGANLEKYREDWWNPPAGSGETAAHQQPDTDQQPDPRRPPAPPLSSYPPPYQQQPQPTYQTPPYQTGPSYQPGGYYQPGHGYGNIPNIPSYMGWAIATLILCFWPTGIVAVVYASKVGNRLAWGDVPGAQEASRKAKMWTWITFAIWAVGAVIAIIVTVLLATAAVRSISV